METIILKLLQAGSFFNPWFWLFAAFLWSRVTYWILGVATHDARYALQRGGQDMQDFETLMEINVRRYTQVFDQYGIYLAGIVGFAFATVATFGFGFDMEAMQATSLLMFFQIIAAIYSQRFAHKLRANPLAGEELCRAFLWHRWWKQVMGSTSLVVIAMYGIYSIAISYNL